MGSTTKILHLESLFINFFEPLDVIDEFPPLGPLEEDGGELRQVVGSDPSSRKKRVRIFIEFIEKRRSQDGNIMQELLDVLKSNERHKWMVPLLAECECEHLIQRLIRYVEKPDKIRHLFNVIFPGLTDVQVKDIMRYLRRWLSPHDREELETLLERHGNTHCLFVLLNKLVIKEPTWIDNFISAVRDLNYGAANPFFTQDSQFSTLEGALRSFIECDDEAEMVAAMHTEEPEMYNESAAPSSLTTVPGNICTTFKKLEIGHKRKISDADITAPAEVSHTSSASAPELDKKWKLRHYEVELCKTAVLGENVIICAPTGSGKTFMSAKIIEEHLRNQSFPKVVFFTPTGGLAQQQFEKMNDYLPGVRKAVLHGNLRKEGCDGDNRQKIYSKDLIVMTPEILLNCLKKGQVHSLFDFTMMIFDECHHARQCHPYNEILLNFYWKQKSRTSGKTLQIIGLTATLGIGNATDVNEAKENIFMLLGSLDARGGISMVRNPAHLNELNQLCPTPAEDTIKMEEEARCSFKTCLTRTLAKVLDVVEKTDAMNHFKIDPPNGAMENPVKGLQWCSKLQRSASQSCDVNGTLARDAISCCEAFKVLFEALDLYVNCRPADSADLIHDFIRKHYEHEPYKNTAVENKLHDILKETICELRLRSSDPECQNKRLEIIEGAITSKLNEDPDSRCMVMVPKRRHASKFTEWMNGSSVLGHLNAKKFTGVGKKNSSASSGTSHAEQKRVIKDFNDGSSKVMICTPDAAGEGIDIQGCNLVITNDCINSETSKVQTKGRARKSNSDVVNITTMSSDAPDVTSQKVKLMEKATREIHKLYMQNKEEYKRRLYLGQKRVALKFEATMQKRGEIPRLNRSRDYEVKCRKCSKTICRSDDVVKIAGNHHTISLASFASQYSKSEHPEKDKIMKGTSDMKHAYKISCGACKYEWGNLVRWRDILVPILKVKGVKFVHDTTPVTPKQWKKAPIQPKSVEFEFIYSLLST